MQQINEAIKRLNNDELVAIPTETVYGLAANAFSDKAINKIYSLKRRPITNPLIVHIAEISYLERVAKNVPDIAYNLAREFWPGPLTLILEKQSHLSSRITAGKRTVGIRVPNHNMTLELLKKLDYPLVAPSANRSNHISPTHPDHVRISFGDNAPFILDGGRSAQGIESTIIGFDNNKPIIYRQGAISQSQIESFLRMEVENNKDESEIFAPGMMKKHYSPVTKLILTDNILKEIIKYSHKKVGLLLPKSDYELEKKYPTKVLSNSGDLHESMTNLYDLLYQLEQMELDLIIAQQVANEGVGIAINDKLTRAAN